MMVSSLAIILSLATSSKPTSSEPATEPAFLRSFKEFGGWDQASFKGLNGLQLVQLVLDQNPERKFKINVFIYPRMFSPRCLETICV